MLSYEEQLERFERATYSSRHMQLYLQVRNEAIAEAVRTIAVQGRRPRVLEVGCGPGLTLSFVADLPCRAWVVGLDRMSTMLRQASAKGLRRENRPALVQAAAPILPFADGSFDVVYATRFIYQFADKAAAYQEFVRVTRPGGIIAVEFYRRPYHLARFYLKRVPKPRPLFMAQHPTLAEVRRVVGDQATYVPLRVAGSRLLLPVLGPQGVRSLLRLAWQGPLRPLVDEYLTVVRKSGEYQVLPGAEQSSAAP